MALWNNLDDQMSKPKYLSVGQIDAINITAAGSGYTDATVDITIDAPPGNGVQATGTVTITNGAVTAVTITRTGTGYTTAPAVSFSSGAGTNAVLTAVVRGVAWVNSDFVFVDLTEAQNASNRIKGLKTPGWNKYTEYVDSGNNTRYKVEPLVAMTVAAATSGDAAGDTVVGDVAYVTSTQPIDASVLVGAGTSFTAAAAGASAFQWQKRVPAGGQYVNIADAGIYSGATTGTLIISTGTTLAINGTRYRCIMLNAGGTASTTSLSALLTVTYGIATQPLASSVTAPAATSFTVVSNGTTSYQWQELVPAGVWTNIVNAGVYSTATTAVLNISNSTGMNGYSYRCVVTDGITTLTSGAALLTVA